MNHEIDVEHKKVLSVKTRALSKILAYSGSAYREEKHVEIAENILGRPFKENTLVRVAMHFDPISSQGYRFGERLQFVYNLPVKYADSDFPVDLYLESKEDIQRLDNFFKTLQHGDYELVLEEIIKDGFLRLSWQKDK